MSLMRGKLFAGALFAGALLGGQVDVASTVEEASGGAIRFKHASPYQPIPEKYLLPKEVTTAPAVEVFDGTNAVSPSRNPVVDGGSLARADAQAGARAAIPVHDTAGVQRVDTLAATLAASNADDLRLSEQQQAALKLRQDDEDMAAILILMELS